SCKPPVVTEAITGFVAKGNKSAPANYFQHDQSIEAVCKEGYRQRGTFTCQEGIWTGNSTCEPEVCSEPEFHFLAVTNGTLVNKDIIFSHGTKLHASCGSSYSLHADIDNGVNGTWTECIHGEWKPNFRCKQRCTPPVLTEAVTGFVEIGTNSTPDTFFPHAESVEAVCKEGYRPQGIFTCQEGIWTGSSTCEPERCTVIITRIRYGRFSHRGRSIFPGEKIPSGNKIQLNCSDGYELYNKTNSMYLNSDQTDIECYQGSFITEIPSCEPKRCFIVPTTDLDYFIRQEKVLENYIQSGTVMNARCSIKTELYLSSSYLEREQEDVRCILGTLKPGSLVCHDKRCTIVITRIRYGRFSHRGRSIFPGEKIPSGSNIQLNCSDGYELYNKTNSMYLNSDQTDIECYQGSFTSEIPSCEPKRCTIVITRIRYGRFSHRGRSIFPGEKIPSGSNIQLNCSDGYELYNKTNSMYLNSDQTDIECYQGSFTSEIPSCEPKRCFIVPTTDLEYFIGQEKVLENYIQSGTEMNARCSNKTELFLSSSYLEREKVYVKCIFGTLKPGSPLCLDSKCTIVITRIRYGRFSQRGRSIFPGEKIPSGSNIQLNCSDGYELYNKTNSMYLNSDQTDIECYQGSFTSEIPSCEPKRCFIVPTTDLEYFIGQEKVLENYIQSGTEMNARCSNKTELFLSSSYLEREKVYVKCIFGTLKPGSPLCLDKMCKTIDVGRDITGFIVRDTKTKLGDFLPHSQSIEAVCDEGYRPHGIITCNAGKWLGKSTCETGKIFKMVYDLFSCVLNDPGMQILSLGNREFLKVGENANVSCKFGYQYVPNIFIKDPYEYYYAEYESTADPSEMPETEDNENLLTISDGKYTCIENGKWEPELRFSCKQIVCDSFDVENLENGKIIYLPHYDYTVGTVASFHCDPGYTRHGPENRTCQIDGTWSGPCVTCQKNTHNSSVACLAPCVPLGARKTGSHPYEIGSVVKFHCLPSKMQDWESSSIICTKNGEYASWKGNTINCKEIICDKGDHYGFENGRVYYSSSVTTVGTEASFICNSGYYRIGPKIRTCQKDGTWSRGCVKCQKHQDNSDNCPVPCIPDGAKRIGSISYKIGSRIQFYCLKSNMNYTVEITCVNDGNFASWKGSNINCKDPVSQGPFASGRQIKVTCEDGFLPNNQTYNVSKCVNGVWTPEIVKCEKTEKERDRQGEKE
ncbi:hypothetical protein ACJMK2_038369, partial [Sinanodonta woodiana]